MREIGSGNEHCHYDWLAVYDGRDEHSPLIGKFCGMGKFPFSIIGKCYLFQRKKKKMKIHVETFIFFFFFFFV